jgi:hydrogenase/urease accessory protein HupE
VILLLLLLVPLQASAHALSPALLTLDELESDVWQARWVPPVAAPGSTEAPDLLAPVLPEGCTGARGGNLWAVSCEDGLVGTLRIGGLEAASAEVVVRVQSLDGAGEVHVLRPESPSVQIGSRRPDLTGWVLLGIEHILKGVDHLAFVFAFVLLIADGRRLVYALTAFTVAHSITLAGSALGAITLPGPPVEAVIALSILLLARELLGDRETATRRWPWAVALGFGLIHGFGFAGALSDLGLPRDGALWALLAFNVGVELGQLAFVALVFLPVSRLRSTPLLARAAPYALGTVAAAWTIQRVLSFWSTA